MSYVSNSTCRHRFGRSGIASLEFALILMPFMVLLIAVFDIGRYLFTVQAMTTLMMNAERAIMISPGLGSQPLCGVTVASWTSMMGITPPPLLDPTQGTICINTISPQGVYQIQVTVTYPFAADLPGLSGLAPNGKLIETATNSF
jgi:Flp pilus assembly protein TadG